MNCLLLQGSSSCAARLLAAPLYAAWHGQVYSGVGPQVTHCFVKSEHKTRVTSNSNPAACRWAAVPHRELGSTEGALADVCQLLLLRRLLGTLQADRLSCVGAAQDKTVL